jgi:hypothetical protein
VAERIRVYAHLVVRFFTSLIPRRPTADQLARVHAVLTPAEADLWGAMPRVDQVESIAVLERLPAAVAADDRWAAAALLHDVGKTASGLGVIGRAAATVRGRIGGGAIVSGSWGEYLRHAEIGADALAAVGARPEAVAWARAHHRPDDWPLDEIPPAVCVALARADGERPPVPTPDG